MLTNIGFSIVIGHILGTTLAVRKIRTLTKLDAPDDVKQIITNACNETSRVIILCTILTVGTWILVHKITNSPV